MHIDNSQHRNVPKPFIILSALVYTSGNAGLKSTAPKSAE